MQHRNTTTHGVWIGLALISLALGCAARAGETNVEDRLRLLQQQNDALQTQLHHQQELIDQLNREVAHIRHANEQHDAEESAPAAAPSRFSFGKIQISGEGGAALFETGSEGFAPNAEFRVDEAKLFVDAPVWGDAYAFAEINLAQREMSDVSLRLGEFYLDVEDLSRHLWGHERELNLRVGRIDVPFGEEYQTRDAIDNRFISHSLSDIWGIDEGIELYGGAGKFSYAVAVQNGGIPVTRDFTADKSVAGRLSFDPLRWLHLSVSGMRTGDLDPRADVLSELWFGNGWFRSLGSPATTRFHANLVEGDVEFRLHRGYVKIFGGYVNYDDNDPAGDNHRDVYYGSVEGVWDLTQRFYAGARLSGISAHKGFPMVGNGNANMFLFGPLAKDLWRLSLGVGYRWNRNLVVKAEYSFEQGREVSGRARIHENLFATEAAFGF